jgi:hypothetical protein
MHPNTKSCFFSSIISKNTKSEKLTAVDPSLRQCSWPFEPISFDLLVSFENPSPGLFYPLQNDSPFFFKTRLFVFLLYLSLLFSPRILRSLNYLIFLIVPSFKKRFPILIDFQGDLCFFYLDFDFTRDLFSREICGFFYLDFDFTRELFSREICGFFYLDFICPGF